MSQKDAARQWSRSSKALDDMGAYQKLFRGLGIQGSSVLEFGVSGREARRIAERGPSFFLGIDKNPESIRQSADYLQECEIPVNVASGWYPRPTQNPNWNLSPNSMNFAVADYTDPFTFDPKSYEKFDLGILTFSGGSEYRPISTEFPFLDPLLTCDYALRPGGSFYFVQRATLPVDKLKSLENRTLIAPEGYWLKEFIVYPDEKMLKASMAGNKSFLVYGDTQLDVIISDGLEDGKPISIYLDQEKQRGMCPLIYTAQFVKED
ncbi:MAG: hypothetical protein JW727_04070 [Candidatus Aenigmarchaeota archaeon]|nr:hypothetical protein [Candidatus Aenigmarchaeota archaeon]